MIYESVTYDEWVLNEAVLAAAEEYAEDQPRPDDAGEAQALYEEAIFAGCVKVYGPKAAFAGYAKFQEAKV